MYALSLETKHFFGEGVEGFFVAGFHSGNPIQAGCFINQSIDFVSGEVQAP